MWNLFCELSGTTVYWRNATGFVMVYEQRTNTARVRSSAPNGETYTRNMCIQGTERHSRWKWPLNDILWAGCFIDGSGKKKTPESPICVQLGRDNCTLGMLSILQFRDSQQDSRLSDNTMLIPVIGRSDQLSRWNQSSTVNRQCALLCYLMNNAFSSSICCCILYLAIGLTLGRTSVAMCWNLNSKSVFVSFFCLAHGEVLKTRKSVGVIGWLTSLSSLFLAFHPAFLPAIFPPWIKRSHCPRHTCKHWLLTNFCVLSFWPPADLLLLFHPSNWSCLFSL